MHPRSQCAHERGLPFRRERLGAVQGVEKHLGFFVTKTGAAFGPSQIALMKPMVIELGAGRRRPTTCGRPASRQSPDPSR